MQCADRAIVSSPFQNRPPFPPCIETVGKPGRPRTVHCKVCGRHVSECGSLSARKKCIDCGVGRATEQQHNMAALRGEDFKLWRERMAASIGATLNDSRADDAD